MGRRGRCVAAARPPHAGGREADVTTPRRRVERTDDHFADSLPTDVAEALAAGVAIGEDGGDRSGPGVAALQDWMADDADRPPGVEDVCTRLDAAVIWEMMVGWTPEVG
jgi:hypothetical protein